MTKGRTALLLSGLLFVTALLWPALKWGFWEPSDIERGSWIYRFKVPAAAKAFPLWGEVEPPLYDVRIADGLSPAVARIRYVSSLSKFSLLREAKRDGFSCELGGNLAFCEKSEGLEWTTQIDIQKEANKRSRVIVDIILRGP